MEFLKDNKDILFEISKYLSQTDMRRLKFAFPNIEIEHLFEQKMSLIVNYFSDKDIAYDEICLLIKAILSSPFSQFLLYNRRYDPETRILTCDIDHRALNLIYEVNFYNYRKFVSPILIDDGILVKIRNGEEWYKADLEYIHPEYYDNRLDDSHINYLISDGMIFDYIENNLDILSDFKIYINSDLQNWTSRSRIAFLINIDKVDLILAHLPEKNRLMFIKSAEEFLDQIKDRKIDPEVTNLINKLKEQ